MRTRTILLVVAILLVAGFAALNWPEIARSTPLSFGIFVTDAPLGAILLALLALTLVLFLASSAAMRTQSLVDYRQHQKALEAQRELADNAEASRFTELRSHLDTQLREMRDRDAISAGEFEKAMVQSQRELRTQLEAMNRMMGARINELEHRLETRFERMGLPSVPLVTTPHGEILDAEPLRAQAQADEARREAEVRDEERQRDERAREERAAADKPAESGWRRWF